MRLLFSYLRCFSNLIVGKLSDGISLKNAKEISLGIDLDENSIKNKEAKNIGCK